MKLTSARAALRGSVLLALLAVGAVALSALGTTEAAGRPAPRDPAATVAASATIPGVNPAVQRWFLDHQWERVELENALFKAAQALATVTADAPASCRRLSDAVQSMQAALPSPLPGLDGPLSAGLVALHQATVQCLAASYAPARATVRQAIRLQTAAQAVIDQILDGD